MIARAARERVVALGSKLAAAPAAATDNSVSTWLAQLDGDPAPVLPPAPRRARAAHTR
jgi:hypothetical protein